MLPEDPYRTERWFNPKPKAPHEQVVGNVVMTKFDDWPLWLQLLVGELLLKNHQLRCEVARLREEEKLQMQPVRFAVSKTIFDWESIG